MLAVVYLAILTFVTELSKVDAIFTYPHARQNALPEFIISSGVQAGLSQVQNSFQLPGSPLAGGSPSLQPGGSINVLYGSSGFGQSGGSISAQSGSSNSVLGDNSNQFGGSVNVVSSDTSSSGLVLGHSPGQFGNYGSVLGGSSGPVLGGSSGQSGGSPNVVGDGSSIFVQPGGFVRVLTGSFGQSGTSTPASGANVDPEHNPLACTVTRTVDVIITRETTETKGYAVTETEFSVTPVNIFITETVTTPAFSDHLVYVQEKATVASTTVVTNTITDYSSFLQTEKDTSILTYTSSTFRPDIIYTTTTQTISVHRYRTYTNFVQETSTSTYTVTATKLIVAVNTALVSNNN